MRRRRQVLVTEDNSPDLAGIISERDFVKALATSTTSTSLVRRAAPARPLAAHHALPLSLPTRPHAPLRARCPSPAPPAAQVRDLMTPKKKLVTVDLDTGIGECMELMRKNQAPRPPS